MERRRNAIRRGDDKGQDEIEEELKEEEAKENFKFLKAQIEKLEREPSSFNNNIWKVKETTPFPRK